MGATKLTVNNETHWKSTNIGTLVRAALKHSKWKPPTLTVNVCWSKPGNSYGEIGLSVMGRRLELNLPKRGPRDSSLTMLATAAVDDQPVLAPSAVYCLVRTMAYHFMGALDPDTMSNTLYDRKRALNRNKTSRVRPTWLPNEIYIKRYAKKKPPRKKSHLEQVELELTSAEVNLARWEKKKEFANNKVKSWRKELKKQQKRLRDGRASAEERGADIEYIGRGHRLYGRI